MLEDHMMKEKDSRKANCWCSCMLNFQQTDVNREQSPKPIGRVASLYVSLKQERETYFYLFV